MIRGCAESADREGGPPLSVSVRAAVGSAFAPFWVVAALVIIAAPRALAAPPAPSTTAQAPAVTLVPFGAPESLQRLARSNANADFAPLANQYEGQEHGGMCGPATAVIVLNALRLDNTTIEKPANTAAFPAEYLAAVPKQYNPIFKRYSQSAFVDDARFQKVKPKPVFYGQPLDPSGKRDPGMQLRQLGDILAGHGLDVQVHPVADDVTGDKERAAKMEIIENLKRAGDYVIVNYSRGALGQKGGGHISPLGAYDEASDSFLVLDVNPNEGKRWVWVPAPALFAAMRTKDTIENRGYLLVKEGSAK